MPTGRAAALGQTLIPSFCPLGDATSPPPLLTWLISGCCDVTAHGAGRRGVQPHKSTCTLVWDMSDGGVWAQAEMPQGEVSDALPFAPTSLSLTGSGLFPLMGSFARGLKGEKTEGGEDNQAARKSKSLRDLPAPPNHGEPASSAAQLAQDTALK